MASKYNPYNDYEKILGYKADYGNAKNTGQDPNQYYLAAMPYYESLINNGYSDLAHELAQSNHAQAGTLRDKYGLKADNQFNLDNDYNTLIGNGTASFQNALGDGKPAVAQQLPNYSGEQPTVQKLSNGTASVPQTAQDIINASHKNDASIDNLMKLGTGETGMANDVFNTAQGIATGAIQTQPSATTQNLYDLYNSDYNRLNGQIQYDKDGNVISGLNTEHYNIGRNQLDYLNNFDITKQPYYQGIMDQYKLGGYNAAQGEYANGAANNGGNIDSYAAANANRQQLAYTNAGMQQAMAMANQNQQNWQNLYSQMSNDLYNQGTLSLQTLGIARDMYAQDSQERMNALDVEGSLASAQMAAAVQQFQSLVEERMKDKGITAEMAMQEKDIAAAKEQLELQLASNERIQEGINALGYYQTDANERMSQDSNYTQRYGYDTNRDIAGINANAQLGVAGINADASKYAAQQSAEASKYGSYLGYQSDIAGYQNMLDRIAAQSTADMTQADYEALKKREYEQWVMDQAVANGWVPSGYTENAATKAQYDTSGGTTDGGNGLTDDQIMQLDIQKFVQDAWNDYKHDKNTFKTVEDIYKAVVKYDAAQYAGANEKVYRQMLNDLIKYAKADTNDTSYIQYLLGATES